MKYLILELDLLQAFVVAVVVAAATAAVIVVIDPSLLGPGRGQARGRLGNPRTQLLGRSENDTKKRWKTSLV